MYSVPFSVMTLSGGGSQLQMGDKVLLSHPLKWSEINAQFFFYALWGLSADLQSLTNQLLTLCSMAAPPSRSFQ